MFKNIYIQSALVFILIVGGYAVYVNLNYVEDPSGDVMKISDTEVSEMEDMRDMNTTEKTIDNGELDYTGTHIMGNGDVMTGSGVVISDAVIREDGMIELTDGTVIEPTFDLR